MNIVYINNVHLNKLNYNPKIIYYQIYLLKIKFIFLSVKRLFLYNCKQNLLQAKIVPSKLHINYTIHESLVQDLFSLSFP